MSKRLAKKHDFLGLNEALTRRVVDEIAAAGKHAAVLAEAPPGAGKSTLTVSVATKLTAQDKKLRLAIVTQTNEQADDLVASLAKKQPKRGVARVVGTGGPSHAVNELAQERKIIVGSRSDDPDVVNAGIVVSTARKWQYERSRFQKGKQNSPFPIALIDEAYQMRSDMLLGIAALFDTLFCVGDPGQLDPFTNVDDSLWKGLPYSPSRAALATLRAYHPGIEPILLPTSWRLPPSAASIVSEAFYPYSGFEPGTEEHHRALVLGKSRRKGRGTSLDVDCVLEQAANTGWAYVELPEKFTVRTDAEIADAIARIVSGLLRRGATVVDELTPKGAPLEPGRIAVVAAHNDQVQAVRYALSQLGSDPDDIVVSTANRIQGREYEVVVAWHPLAGRRDATAFHLEAGRMCVMLSRHRHACIVVGRAGTARLLSEFPDSEPIFLDEPEKFPDGWQANYLVLQHLGKNRTD